VTQRDPLVEHAAVLLANSDRCNDVVSTVKGTLGVRCGDDANIAAGTLCLVFRDRREQVESLGVDIDEPQLVESDAVRATQCRGREQWRPGTSTDQRQLHVVVRTDAW